MIRQEVTVVEVLLQEVAQMIHQEAIVAVVIHQEAAEAEIAAEVQVQSHLVAEVEALVEAEDNLKSK